jgi:hypothetical protein
MAILGVKTRWIDEDESLPMGRSLGLGKNDFGGQILNATRFATKLRCGPE